MKSVVVGAGKMGAHHARVFGASGVFDVDVAAAERVARATGARVMRSFDEAIEHADLVVIATPTELHFEQARRALLAKRHVLVEKPVAATSAEALTLCAIAREQNVKLFAGHSERFNASLRALADACASETIATIETHRTAAVEAGDLCLNLAVHDIDLVALLARAPAMFVSASGDLHQAEIVLRAGAATATVHVSRRGEKRRMMHVQTARNALDANLLAASGEEPLALQAAAVRDALDGKPSAIATGEDGASSVAIAEAASAQIAERGIFAAE